MNADVADLDGQYRPLGPFGEWQACVVASDVWDEFHSVLERLRGDATPNILQASIDEAIRSAALDTGAIEGLYKVERGITFTVAVQAAMWESRLDEIGPDVRRHFDAQLSAYELVLDAATQASEISEAWLRQLHATVTAAQDTYRVLTSVGWADHTFPHGAYKDEPNHVIQADGRPHAYAPVVATVPEMHRLMQECRTASFNGAHPAIQAAYAHHGLTSIHPFADGNGRVARALASVFLYRAAGVPLVVFADQLLPYLNALEAADSGKPQEFVDFVVDRALDAMASISNRLRSAKSPRIGPQVDALKNLLVSHGALTHEEVDSIGARVLQQVHQAFEKSVPRDQLGSDLSMSVTFFGSRVDSTFGDRPYRPMRANGAFQAKVEVLNPVTVSVHSMPTVGVAKEVTNRFTFIVIDSHRPQTQPLRLRLSDVHPQMTGTATDLINGWVEGVVSGLLTDLRTGVAQTLRQQGLA